MNNLDDLQHTLDAFLLGCEKKMTVEIGKELLKKIREKRNLGNCLYYFIYGRYKFELVISKEYFEVDPEKIEINTMKMFWDGIGCKKHDIKMWKSVFDDVMFYSGSEYNFVSLHFLLKKNIINEIKESINYNNFKNERIVPVKYNYTQTPCAGTKIKLKHKVNTSIYKTENNGKYFLSFDLNQANFQIIKSRGLLNYNNWAELVSKYTKNQYFQINKKLRLSTLGDSELFPKKQKLLWENHILNILDGLISNKIFNEQDFAVFNSDEIVFHAERNTAREKLSECMKYISEHFPSSTVKSDFFMLEKISKDKNFYVKVDQDSKKLTWKCVNSQEIELAQKLWELKNNPN